MIRRLLLFIVCANWAGLAWAQGINVQSGEHDGFTRLVAAIGADRDWEIERDGREVHISFSPDVPEFDLQSVFTLISRDRVADLRSDAGLVMQLGCDCSIDVSRYRGRYVVIDISDDPYQPTTRAASTVDLPQPTQAAQHDPPENLTPIAEEDPAPSEIRPTFDMEEAAAIMAEQLARAAAAGLLEAAPSEPLTMADPLPEPETPTEIPATSHHSETIEPSTDLEHEDGFATAPTQPESTPQPPPPIVTANAYDLNIATQPGRLIASAPTNCIAAPARPILDWAGDLDFFNALGGIRARLYDDRGTLQDDAALELSELYLVHGFGAEAQFWLSEMHRPPEFHQALAQYLEFGADTQFGSFADQELCPEALSLWLFLTDQEDPRPSEEQRRDILARYFELPIPLRDIIGSDMAQAFLAAGDEGSALEIREVLHRGGRLSAQELAFLDARLPGTPPPPETLLEPANAGSVRAGSALALRIFSDIRTQGTARSADLVAADALLRETSPDLVVEGLRHAAALGHALNGDIQAALSQLALRGQRDAESIRPVFADILIALMEQQRTAPVLLLLSSEEFGQFGYFPNPAFRRRVARYLLDHGLPDMARDLILAGGSDHSRDRELLTLAYDRLGHDRLGDSLPEQSDPISIQPVPVAETPEEMMGLLQDSRAIRQQAQAILEGNSPPPSD